MRKLFPLVIALCLAFTSLRAATATAIQPSLAKASPLTLLAGPCLLGGWMFIRRRRRNN